MRWLPLGLAVWAFGLVLGSGAVSLGPEDNATTVVFCPHFTWESRGIDQACEVQIASDDAFEKLVDTDTISAVTGWYVCAKRLAPGTYYWRLRFGETGDWSQPRALHIVEPRRVLRVNPGMAPEQLGQVLQQVESDPHSVRLEFEKGDYVFTPHFEKAVLTLRNARDVVIEGNGSRFINKEASAQFWKISDSTNIVISGLSYSYDPYPSSFVRVLSVAPEAGGLEVEVLKGFDDTRYPRRVNQMFCYAVNPDNHRQLHPDRPGHTYLDPAKTERTGPHRYRYQVRGAGEKVSLGRLRAGDHLVVSYRRWPAGMVFRCTDFTFYHVENLNAEGAVFMGGGNQDMKFIGYRSRSALDPMPGNAWVSANDRRGPWIEDCVFETLSDDGPNITGNLYLIAEMNGKNTFRVKSGVGYQDAAWMPGDHLVFWNPLTGMVIQETDVAEIASEELAYGPVIRLVNKVVVTKDPVGGLSPGTDPLRNTHIYNLSCQNSGFVARHNRIVDGRRFGFNVKALNAVIEKNHFEGLASSAVYVENEPTGSEGLVGRNILVQDNTMVNCGYGGDAAALKRGGVQVNLWRIKQPGEKDNESPWMGHRDVVIRNNRLIDWESYGLVVDNVDGCRIEDNEFVNRDKQGFLRDTNIGIWVRAVTTNVIMAGNRILDSRGFEKVREP